MADKSSGESSKAIPTNEEIVEEVMKGVKDYLTVEPKEESSSSKGKTTSSSFATEDKHNTDKAGNNECFEDIDPMTSENGTSDRDDFIDELSLKDKEVTLSDDEKEQLRSEAETHKLKGNDLFKIGSYEESIGSYTLGLRTCPLAFPKERSILYSNRAAAKMKLDLKPSAIDDCTKAVELDPSYLKARFRRAQLYEETDKLDEALADYQEILKLDPLHREALYASKRLPEKINERNEKMKADMMAKLKDLGNMILRPFNLSTDNFQVNQDPNTGGYSINFQPNGQ